MSSNFLAQKTSRTFQTTNAGFPDTRSSSTKGWNKGTNFFLSFILVAEPSQPKKLGEKGHLAGGPSDRNQCHGHLNRAPAASLLAAARTCPKCREHADSFAKENAAQDEHMRTTLHGGVPWSSFWFPLRKGVPSLEQRRAMSTASLK